MHANGNERLGYLRTCMDRRFVEATRRAFEEVTGLKNAQYWHEANPGGAGLDIDPTGEDYAAAHGATIFGWQAHGDKCGGQPGVGDAEIEARLDALIAEKMKKFPDAQHFRIFAIEGHIQIEEVKLAVPVAEG